MDKNDKLYKISSHIMLTTSNDNSCKLLHMINNWEIDVSENMLAIINLFHIPCKISTAVFRLNNKFHLEGNPLLIIEKLIKDNIIEEYSFYSSEISEKSFGGIFNAPYMPFEQSLRSGSDILFFGVPYDVSVTNKSGAKFAPDYIRRNSKGLFNYKEVDRVPVGVWDYVKNKRTLDGIRMVDCGDLFSGVFTRNDENYVNLENIVHLVLQNQLFFVALGGDHSITLPIVNGILKVHEKIGIIQLDAHDDYSGEPTFSYQEGAYHSNFMNWLVHHHKVDKVVQIGIRQLENVQPICNKIEVIPPPYDEEYLKNIINNLDNTIPYYLTVDIDCLDPSVIRSTGTPLPGGYSYEQLKSILKILLSRLNFIGMDLVELIPSENTVEGLMASDIIYNVISEVFKEKN